MGVCEVRGVSKLNFLKGKVATKGLDMSFTEAEVVAGFFINVVRGDRSDNFL